MAYDEDLAELLRDALAPLAEVTERKMFGGLAFLVRGHMTVVASGKGGMMIRADPDTADELATTTPARLAEMRGQPMRGWLYLDASALEPEGDLERWVDLAVSYSSTLPAKNR